MSENQPSHPPIGFVVVHGIGNQRPGDLSAELASHLADPGSLESIEPSIVAGGGGEKDEGCGLPPARRILVAGKTVLVREAHWASHSDLGNPPCVRAGEGVVREFFNTVVSTWQGWSMTRLTRRWPPTAAFILWGLFGLLFTVSCLVEHITGNETAAKVAGSVLILCGAFAAFRFLKYRIRKLRRATPLRRTVDLLWAIPAAFLNGAVHVLLLIIAAELLCVLAILVMATVPVIWVGRAMAWAFAAFGGLLAAPWVHWVRRWVYRLGWVMIGLPVQSLMLVIKATANLASIAATERKIWLRVATAPWFVVVYAGSLLLMFCCEILLGFPVAVGVAVLRAGEDDWTGAIWAAVCIAATVVLGLYLLVLKALSPVIDLLVDVQNYHLGSAADRRVYHDRVNAAVHALRQAGCGEIHVLAHSLGTVITYDWLCGPDSGDSGVAVLHTIGSPLNKLWYIDHARDRRRVDAKGPPNLHKCRWTNYWAWSDPVSGRLVRYESAALQLSNTRLRRLGYPLVSHVGYWKNPVVIDSVREAIMTSGR